MIAAMAFHPAVREETDAAYQRYEAQRTGLGERFLAAVCACLARIERNPELYGLVHKDARAAMVRRFPYVVYFRIQGGRVNVLAIQHGARDPGAWQSRMIAGPDDKS